VIHFCSKARTAHGRNTGYWLSSARLNRGLAAIDILNFTIAPLLLVNAVSLKVDHPHDHGAARVEGQILESPAAIKCPCPIVDRMRDDAEASDLAGGSQRRAKREEEERAAGSAFAQDGLRCDSLRCASLAKAGAAEGIRTPDPRITKVFDTIILGKTEQRQAKNKSNFSELFALRLSL